MTEKHTEASMAELLQARYAAISQGRANRYVTARGVRSDAGWKSKRTCDFMALDTWQSSGLALHGHEIKVSRADWKHELEQPEKSEAFIPYCTYWWLVVSDPKIVQPEELPGGWGLLVAHGDWGLRVNMPAPKRAHLDLPRGMFAAFARAIVR